MNKLTSKHSAQNAMPTLVLSTVRPLNHRQRRTDRHAHDGTAAPAHAWSWQQRPASATSIPRLSPACREAVRQGTAQDIQGKEYRAGRGTTRASLWRHQRARELGEESCANKFPRLSGTLAPGAPHAPRLFSFRPRQALERLPGLRRAVQPSPPRECILHIACDAPTLRPPVSKLRARRARARLSLAYMIDVEVSLGVQPK